MYLEETVVCCCAVDTWSKFVAYVHIFISAILTLMLLVPISLFISKGEKGTLEYIQDSNSFLLIPLQESPYGVVVSFVFFLLALSIYSCIMGFVLHKGATKRIARYLDRYIICVAVDLIIFTVMTFKSLGGSNVTAGLLIFVLTISMVSFGASMVYTLKQDIEKEEAATAEEAELLRKAEMPENEELEEIGLKSNERPKIYCIFKE